MNDLEIHMRGCSGCNEKLCTRCTDYNKWEDINAPVDFSPSSGGESKKYGKYHGELTEVVPLTDEIIAPEICFGYSNIRETGEFISKLHIAGVKETLFDVDTDGGSDTLFFETDQDTNYPELMVLITKLRPDEFDQQTPNCFRMWFD